METSRDQGLKQANMMQEQRTIDGHIIDDARHKAKIVNETPETDNLEKLDDTEKHFGNKTEAEVEQEYSDDDKKENHERTKGKEEDKKKPGQQEHHIDTLA